MILMIIPRITLFKVYITPLQHIPCFITWVVGKLVHKTTIAHLVIWQEKMADKRLLLSMHNWGSMSYVQANLSCLAGN